MKPDAVLDALVAGVVQRMSQGGAAGVPSGAQYRALPTGTPSEPYYHGPNSLFGVMGVDRDIISTMVQPRGLADSLPVVPTNIMFPMFAYFTGFDDAAGAEPNGVCDDPPSAGPGRSCYQTAQWGRFSRQTRELEVNRLGQRINDAEVEFNFVNNPILSGMRGLTVPGSIPANANLQNEVVMRFMEIGYEFQRWFARKLYEGNPANNTGGNGYREFPGLDILISRGKVDAQTNTPCPSLDSDIKDANYMSILNNGTTYVHILSSMMRFLRMNAENTGLSPVTWEFVMRPGAFWEITSIWPCAYMAYRCGTVNGATGNASLNMDAGDMIQMRDAMRNGNYLLIDGVQYPVRLDSTLREETNTQTSRVPNTYFASDIYIIPRTYLGNRPALFWQTYDYRTSLNELGNSGLASQYFWTDDGRYLWHFKPPMNWCIQWLAKIEPRLILRVPQFAGRLTNVMYQPLQHENDPFPGDGYHVGGGVAVRSDITRYAEWGAVS